MAPTDKFPQGGRLEDMAQHGTTIPSDSATQRTIPSVPRPDQINIPADLSHTNPAHATDNAFDIPRSTRDTGATGTVMTGIGDQIHANIEKKNLDDAGLVPGAKGHDQRAKLAKKGNLFDAMAQGHHGVQAAPGEEDEDPDVLAERRERNIK